MAHLHQALLPSILTALSLKSHIYFIFMVMDWEALCSYDEKWRKLFCPQRVFI